MPDERAELQRKLADAKQRLAELPLVHEVEHHHSVIARRIALETKISSLEERLSTAPVYGPTKAVETQAPAVDDGPCLDDQPASPAQSGAQADPQP